MSDQISPGDVKNAYCVPVDEQGQELEDIAVLEVPLEGKYSVNKAANSMIRIVLNFVGFSAMVAIAMFGAPGLYKMFLTQLIADNYRAYPPAYPNKSDALVTSEVFISIIAVILFISYTSEGFSTGRSGYVIFAITIAIMMVVAFARIQMEKMDEAAFFKNYLGEQGLRFGEFKPGMIMNFFSAASNRKGAYFAGIIFVVLLNVIMFIPMGMNVSESKSTILTTIFGGLYLSTFFAYVNKPV